MEMNPRAYAVQIAIFLSKGENGKAYSLGKEFMERNGRDALADYMCAMAAFMLKRFGEAEAWGKKAFSLSSSKEDMLSAAVLAGLACYRRGDYGAGLRMLKEAEGIATNEDLEELLIAFSLARKDDSELLEHIGRLSELNHRRGKRVVERILGGGG